MDCKWAHQLKKKKRKQRKSTSLSWPTVCIKPYLCGLTLLLKLLQLLGSEETYWLIASDELSTCWHGCEDDVATQSTEAVEETEVSMTTSLRLKLRLHTQ